MPNYFGQVRWCEEDVKNLLESHGIPATADNLDVIIRNAERHIEDAMIERGWEVLEYWLSEMDSEGRLEKEEK